MDYYSINSYSNTCLKLFALQYLQKYQSESNIPGAWHWALSITNSFRSGKFLLGRFMKHALGNVVTVSYYITSEREQILHKFVYNPI